MMHAVRLGLVASLALLIAASGTQAQVRNPQPTPVAAAQALRSVLDASKPPPLRACSAIACTFGA